MVAPMQGHVEQDVAAARAEGDPGGVGIGHLYSEIGGVERPEQRRESRVVRLGQRAACVEIQLRPYRNLGGLLVEPGEPDVLGSEHVAEKL